MFKEINHLSITYKSFILEVESRTKGLRPRTQKKSWAKARAKDPLLKHRPSRGQGPRSQEQVLNVFARFLAISKKILTIQNIVLSSAKDRAIFEDFRLRGQGQALQNVSWRPRTSLRTPLLRYINPVTPVRNIF